MLSVTCCTSLALISTLQLRMKSVLHQNYSIDPWGEIPESQQRRMLSSSSLELFRAFFHMRDSPQTIAEKDNTTNDEEKVDTTTDQKGDIPINLSRVGSALTPMPLEVCGRVAPIPHDIDVRRTRKYRECPLLQDPPEQTTLLLLEGLETFGRTGNNLIEFLHALQFARDHNAVVGVMMGSWPMHLITFMWMAIQDNNIAAWRIFMERAFCIKTFNDPEETEKYKEVIHMDTEDLFMYTQDGPFYQYVEFQGHILRTLFRSYNNGIGVNMRQKPVKDMCSVIEAIFGNEKHSAVYSVVHSRSLEGRPGQRLLRKIARNTGCDPRAALDMTPEYVKAVLEPRGMLDRPILFITDHQRPEILENLLADPDIGPNIRLIPEDASWVGGDITLAVMADVFIGNPASSFSGFIAKSRVSLGYDDNYLFRKKNDDGEWVDVCDERCIFDHKVMNVMA